MLRRTITSAVVLMVLSAGLLVSAPTTVAAPSYDNSIGAVRAPMQTWRKKCARYLVRWRFHPPSPDWQVSAQIVGPQGFNFHTLFWDADAHDPDHNLDQRRGKLRYTLCGTSAKPGRYKIEMTMIYQVDRDVFTVRRSPTFFRLVRR